MQLMTLKTTVVFVVVVFVVVGEVIGVVGACSIVLLLVLCDVGISYVFVTVH